MPTIDFSRQKGECKDFVKQTKGKECTYLKAENWLYHCMLSMPCLCPFFTIVNKEAKDKKE